MNANLHELKMRPIEKLINITQIFAAIGLGISYFLPFYQSVGFDEAKYVDEWLLFFWTIPVLVILYKLSNRWLRAALCFFAAIGGLLDLFLLTFVATFKSAPLIGFDVAKISIAILVLCWLALCIISLSSARQKSP
jgi:hypothetical protein